MASEVSSPYGHELNKFRVIAEFRDECTVQQEIDAQSGQTVSRTWNKARSLGTGAFGQVRQEARQDRRGDWHYRAVKACKISALRRANVDYMREVSALAALSSSRYSGLFVRLSAWWTDTTTLYFAMEYMGNGDLSAYINSTLTEEDAKEITADIMSGLVVMHQEGITHRDLKPQKRPESAKWWVKIGDFGVSKRIVEGSETSLRTALGTKPYCAPEILGYVEPDSENSAYDSKVDMWSLGCVLFNLGTQGRNPFTEPDLVRYCDGNLSFRQLQKIIVFNEQGKSLIANLLQPEAINRPTASDALKHPWFTSKSEALGISNLPPTPSLNTMSKEPEKSQPDAPQNRNSFLQPTSGPLASSERDISATPTVSPEASNTQEYLDDKLWNAEITLETNSAVINQVAFSPNGELLATASSKRGGATQLSGHNQNLVTIWDVAKGKIKCKLERHTDSVECVAFSPDSKMVVSGSFDRKLGILTVSDSPDSAIMIHQGNIVSSVAWSPSGILVASGTTVGAIKLWTVSSKEMFCSLVAGNSITYDLSFVGDDRTLISGSRHMIRIWDTEKKAILKKVRVDNMDPVIAVSPDSRDVVFWSAGCVEIWKTQKWHCERRKSVSSAPWSMAWSANGRILAIATDHDVQLSDPRSDRILHTFSYYTKFVKSVAFSPKRAILAWGCSDGSFKLQDLNALHFNPVYLQSS